MFLKLIISLLFIDGITLNILRSLQMACFAKMFWFDDFNQIV